MSRKLFTLIAMSACVVVGACLNALFAKYEAPSQWKALEKAYAEANVELAKARLAERRARISRSAVRCRAGWWRNSRQACS